MPHQHNAGQLRKGLDHIEVAQRADFKESHAVFLRVGSGLLCRDLPFEGQVKSVANQDAGYTRGMLYKKKRKAHLGRTSVVPQKPKVTFQDL